jgi:hypothetical protein
MNTYCALVHRLLGAEDEAAQINVIGQLAPFAAEVCVLEALCRLATETDSHHVRVAAINTLNRHPTGANRHFIRYAGQRANRIRRQGALLCLGLMGCTTAKAVVLKGLRARSSGVRLAAALSTGLYHDKDALAAFERFFDRNPVAICLNVMEGWPVTSETTTRRGIDPAVQSASEAEYSARPA